ncbi:MAG TPA: hypothetical protein DCG12_22285 [Planctomycetaceae bacterium]|nr:hypothetical protein [Planctomycetaceae bacterium]
MAQVNRAAAQGFYVPKVNTEAPPDTSPNVMIRRGANHVKMTIRLTNVGCVKTAVVRPGKQSVSESQQPAVE